MFQHVGTNDEVVNAEHAEFIPIQVDRVKRGGGKLRQKVGLLVGELDGAARLHELTAKDAVATAKVKRPRSRSKMYPLFTHPTDRVLRLNAVKALVITMCPVPGDEFMNDHWFAAEILAERSYWFAVSILFLNPSHFAAPPVADAAPDAAHILPAKEEEI